MITPEPIKKLTQKFSEFPGVGPKQAARFVFYLVGATKNYKEELAKLIENLNSIKPCPNCNFPTADTLCVICANKNRQQNLICIVEKVTDLLNIEKTQLYKGAYYILQGNIFENEKIELISLKKRIENLLKNHQPQEVEIILATNPTTEGEATTLYVEKELKPLGAKLSRLARGLPSGAELEYLDPTTLQDAFKHRTSTYDSNEASTGLRP